MSTNQSPRQPNRLDAPRCVFHPGYDNTGYTTLDGRKQVVVSVSSSTMDDKAGEPAAHAAFYQLVMAAGCR